MQFYTKVFNPYEVNTYIVASNQGKCAIIDPACCSPAEQQSLVDFINSHKLTPIYLITTHGHYDHVVGNAFVQQTWKDIKAIRHKDDEQLIASNYMIAENFGYPVTQPPVADSFIADGDIIEFDDVRIEFYHVPGHSPGSVVLYLPSEKILIPGDVLFCGSIGRTDLPGGNYQQLIEGIRTKILERMPKETDVYPGHGPATSLEYEALHNPYLCNL